MTTLYSVGSRDGIHVIRFSNKHPYLLSYLTSQLFCSFQEKTKYPSMNNQFLRGSKKSCVPQKSGTSIYNNIEELILFLLVHVCVCVYACAGTYKGQNMVLGFPRTAVT